ncbi:purine-nucleoside phosphorylase [Fusobacterium polymorphum]|uniref:Uridine phosphorylase n=2 Tax=Fusobacterium nucleatum subsp. polymorphum TaxID=76857 RepID=A0A246ECU1_FUSNP|nr:purine-nucleoside phosphorylase [Fusobacterium polymorphum]PHI05895.1 purine-nucleoside phosphorylase [Fusobacterium polymorphum]
MKGVQVMSIHIGAKAGDIAETVLLPGDPKRAKWIAENYLENLFCYTDIRGMLGFTGTYKGKKVSIQGTGMGIPSISIYITELMKDYGVKNLIRVGSAGSYQKDVNVRDVVIAMSTSTDSNINNRRFNGANFSPTANFELFKTALKVAEEKNIKIKAGNVLTSDEFYNDNSDYYKKWADFGVLAVEMETAGLYTLAAKYKAKALSILTISDSLVSPEITSPEEREKTFSEMIELALETAIRI